MKVESCRDRPVAPFIFWLNGLTSSSSMAVTRRSCCCVGEGFALGSSAELGLLFGLEASCSEDLPPDSGEGAGTVPILFKPPRPLSLL